MSRVALDSNLLVYAELEPESAKGRLAAGVILRAAVDGVISAQVLGEFLRVVQRKAPVALPEALVQVALYRAAFLSPPSTDEIIMAAAELALTSRLQLWDAVVCVTAFRAGARTLLSEDMQDGGMISGLRIINPFNPANTALLRDLVGEGPQ